MVGLLLWNYALLPEIEPPFPVQIFRGGNYSLKDRSDPMAIIS